MKRVAKRKAGKYGLYYAKVEPKRCGGCPIYDTCPPQKRSVGCSSSERGSRVARAGIRFKRETETRV